MAQHVNNLDIPQIGLGLWKVTDEKEFTGAFDAAVKAGYRHFDSAQIYGNEQLLGKAWKQSGLKREELFLTTKIHIANFGTKRTPKSFDVSLEKLQTDYVDLLLLHFPVTITRKKAWGELEKIKAAGKAKMIGVSNYTIRHLEEMKSYANEMPAVNQVELHVFLQQPELLDYCKKEGIIVEAYSPLAHAKDMDEPIIQKIAKRRGKSYAQIMLRWCIQKDLVVLPKSVTPARIAENIDIFDFELSNDEMKQLTTLDRGLRTCWDPTLVP
jgi:methylglyoxal/glyoxal reductase